MPAVCGPLEIMDALFVWTNYYLPLIFLSIFFIYSITMYIKLRYHLYIYPYQWLLKPSKIIKKTSLLIPISFGTMCLSGIIDLSLQLYGYHQTNIEPPGNLADTDYPMIYQFAGFFQIFIVLLYVMGTMVGFIHVKYFAYSVV